MHTRLAAILLVTTTLDAQTDAERRAIVHIDRIWNAAPHCAFTTLCEWQGELYCAFREGSGHVPGTNGVVRILVQRAGAWRSIAVLDEVGVDLRDPKLAVTPDGRLLVLMGGSTYQGKQRTAMHSRVCIFERDGSHGTVQPIQLDPSFASGHDWLWRVTFHQQRGYGTLYQGKPTGPELHLMSTTDGVRYQHVTRLAIDGRPNETTLRMLPDGRMIALVRREEGDRRGMIGVAAAPFTDWTFHTLPFRLGGPELLVVADQDADQDADDPDDVTLLAATRSYAEDRADGNPSATTMLARVHLDGAMTPLLQLPSGGDTSYAGFVCRGDRLHVSYYSSHEHRTAIYLAELRLDELLRLGR